MKKNFLYAALASLLVAAVLSSINQNYAHLPEVSTIGYPLFGNFDINRLFRWGVIWIWIFPFLTWFVFERRLKKQGLLHDVVDVEGAKTYKDFSAQWPTWVDQFLVPILPSVSFAFIGLFLFPHVDWSRQNFSLQTVGLALAVYLLVQFFSHLLGKHTRFSKIFITQFSVTFLSVFSILSLAGASYNTKIILDERIISFSWFSISCALWIVAVLTLAVGVVRFKIKKISWTSISRFCFLVLSIPITVYMCRAYIIGGVGLGDLFHAGEAMASGSLLNHGLLPFKDVLFIHGLLQDPFSSLLGYKVFSESVWSHHNAFTLLWRPLYWTLWGWFLLFFFRRSFLWIIAIFFLMSSEINPFLSIEHFRFLTLPVVGLTFYFMLKTGRVWITMIFCFLAVWNFVIVPESAFTLMAFGVVTPLYEWAYRKKGDSLLKSFQRTLVCAISVIVALTSVAIVFHHLGILKEYIEYFKIFAPNHKYTGGVPFYHETFSQVWWAKFAVIFTVVTSFWTFLFKLRVSKTANTRDWLFFAWTLFTALYFRKFLSRADGHIFHVYAAAFPILIYLVYEFVWYVENNLKKTVWKFPNQVGSRLLSIGLVIIVAMLSIKLTVTYGLQVPYRLEAHLSHLPIVNRVGFSSMNPKRAMELEDFKSYFRMFYDHTDTFFDFTNTPALFHFLLDIPVSSRFFHVSMASGEFSQSVAVEELKKSQPKMIAITGNWGLLHWDGVPQSVRHYDLSEYLLKNYTPFVELHSYLFMIKNSFVGKLIAPKTLPSGTELKIADLQYGTTACDWGYSPAYFKRDRPRVEIERVKLDAKSLGENLFEVDLASLENKKSFSYLDLQIEAPKDVVITFSDSPENLDLWGAEIRFHTDLKRKKSYLIQVGACYQWYWWQGHKMYIRANGDFDIKSLSLIKNQL